MGSLCATEYEGRNVPSIKLVNINFKTPEIHFVMEDYPLLYGQCLILNTKQSFNLDMINRTIGTHWSKLIKQTVEAQLQKQQPKVGQVVAIKNPIRELKVKTIVLAVMPVWKNSKANKIVRDNFEKCMEQVERRQERVLLISELSDELGIPNNVACKILANLISDNREKLDKVVFIFNNKQRREFYITYFETFRGGQTIVSSIPNDY